MQELFEKYLSAGFEYAVASKPLANAECTYLRFKDCTKVKIRPVLIKQKNMFQVTYTVGNKEIHENIEKEQATALLSAISGKPFANVEAVNDRDKLCILTGKKGHVTVKEHKNKKPETATVKPDSVTAASHNREKNYILPEGIPVPFLVKLGVMTTKGKVVASKYDKFRQINRYLEFVEDIIPSLPKDREISIIDFGCGKSYLTFALYHYLNIIKGLKVRITGLDLKADVIEMCNSLSMEFGYDENLSFKQGDIAGFDGESLHPDMVVTLHACDTATDYALEKAVKWGAAVILCVPCCQHELNRQIKNDLLSPIMKYGLLKERFAALLTDGLRAEMLEESGYRTQILEFIDMEHTPKNILIRAVRQPLKIKKRTGYEKTTEFLHVNPTLQRLLFKEN